MPTVLTLEQVLKGMSGGSPEPQGREVATIGMSKVGAIANLMDAYKDFLEHKKSPKWKPGDLVTPKGGFCSRLVGNPCLVIDTAYEEPMISPTTDTSSSGFGRKLDIRIITVVEGNIASFWDEGYQFEAYDPAIHDK